MKGDKTIVYSFWSNLYKNARNRHKLHIRKCKWKDKRFKLVGLFVFQEFSQVHAQDYHDDYTIFLNVEQGCCHITRQQVKKVGIESNEKKSEFSSKFQPSLHSWSFMLIHYSSANWTRSCFRRFMNAKIINHAAVKIAEFSCFCFPSFST